MTRENSPKAPNFLFLQNRDKPNSEAKKVLRPPTLAGLRTTAARVLQFDEGETVKSIYTQAGVLVTAFKSITPGATVLVSSREPDEFFQPPPPSPDPPSRGLSKPGTPADGSRLSPRTGSRQGSVRMHRSNSSFLAIIDEKASASTSIHRRATGPDVEDEEDLGEHEMTDAERYAKTGISLRALGELLSFLPGGLRGNLEEILKWLPGVVARLASSAQIRQKIHDTATYHAIMSILWPLPEVTGYVMQFAKQLVDRSTFGNSFETYTKLRVAIVGPEKSGKTIFFQVLTSVLISRLVANGQHRRTLIVFLDAARWTTFATDTIKIYNDIVRSTFNHLAAQRLDFLPFRDSLILYFIKVPTLDRVQAFPQKFVLQDEFRDTLPMLTDLAETIFDAARVQCSFRAWMTSVVMFPRFVALAFGFGSVQFLFDHLDLTDVEAIPRPPFEGEAVTVIEYFKFMLSHDSHVVSCVNQTKMVDAMDLLTEDGIDLRDGTELVNVVDIDEGHADRYVFTLTVEGEEIKPRLTIRDCGGCPGYLRLWDKVVLQADHLVNEERKNKDSRSARELRLSLFAKIRELAALVLFSVDPDDGTRTPLNKQIKEFVISNTGTELDRESAYNDE
jgi:hypothetical protein